MFMNMNKLLMYGRFRKCGIIFFFSREKYLMFLFQGRFRRGRDIFDLLNCPERSKGQLRGQ